MRHLSVKIEVHFFSGDESNDDQIDRRMQGYGLYSPRFYKQILSYNNQTIEVEFDDDISLGRFEKLIYDEIWDNYREIIDGSTIFFFVTSGARCTVDNPDLSFCNVLDKYIDPESDGCIRIGLYVCEDAGQFEKDGELRFYFHSREKGKHNEPHVHVYDVGRNFEEPISVLTGDVLTKNPKMPRKYQLQAKNFILEHQVKFINGWNMHTDGINVDLNNLFGLSNY